MKNYTKKDLITFFESVNILTLAAVGERGPISSPLLFTVDDQLNFFFATHRDSFKAQAMLAAPKVALSIWEFDQILVQVEATAQPVTDKALFSTTLTNLATAATRLKGFWPPVLQISGDEYLIFQATPSWVRILDLSNQTILAGDTPFQILPL